VTGLSCAAQINIWAFAVALCGFDVAIPDTCSPLQSFSAAELPQEQSRWWAVMAACDTECSAWPQIARISDSASGRCMAVVYQSLSILMIMSPSLEWLNPGFR
jgi:hypothetical protein